MASMPAWRPRLAWLLALVAALLLPWFSTPARAAVQPVPALSAHVIDQTATLSAQEQAQLEAQLTALERDTGAQVVVLMVASTSPEDIAAYAHRVASTWMIGRKDVGDGLLVLVAKNDRRMRIEVAKTLEGAIPDLRAARIIDETMKPAFQAGKFAVGIGDSVAQISALIKGEALPPPRTTAPSRNQASSALPDDPAQLLLFFFIFVMVGGSVLRSMLGRALGSLATGGAAGLVAAWLTSSVLLGIGAGVAALFVVLLAGTMRGGSSIGGGGGGFGGGGGAASFFSIFAALRGSRLLIQSA